MAALMFAHDPNARGELQMGVGETRHRDRPRRPSNAEHREGIRFLVAGDGLPQGAELRETANTAAPVLFGHFTPYDRWAEIDSFFEGHFMERTVKGAFQKTIVEQRDSIKALFQHGRDPQIGMKPLGPISVLREEDDGPYYEVELLDADYVRDTVLPGLRAGLYGASYKFRVLRESRDASPERSAWNPDGIEERTILEAQVFEFGPVTFPAFQEASAGVRSGTDDYFLAGLATADPEIVRMAADGADFSSLIAHRLGVVPSFMTKTFEERATVKAGATGCPPGMKYGVLDATGKVVACHATQAQADAHATAMPKTPAAAPKAAPPGNGAYSAEHNGAERMDSEDVGTLAQMLALASCYIDDQDESDDAANVPLMQKVQQQLIDLLAVEATEVEPPEPEDEEHADTPTGETRSKEQEQEQARDAATVAPVPPKPDQATTKTEHAAPGLGIPTPLLGVKKEPWRL